MVLCRAVKLISRLWGVVMRVLVAGDRGYIGAVLVPLLRRGRARGRRARPRPVRGLRPRPGAPLPGGGASAPAGDMRDVTAGRAGWLRRGALPGGAVQRPARRPQPRDDVLGEPRRDPAPGPGRQAGRRRALPVRVVLQPVRRGRLRRGGRGRRPVPRHAVRREQGGGRARACRCSPTTTSARPTSATPPRTAPRPGSAWTSW